MPEYIDRDTAVKEVMAAKWESGSDGAMAMEVVAAPPAADVEPVRHGRWIFGDTMGHSWMKCSECLVSQSGQTLCFTYCPNCGARMGKGVQ